MACCCDKCAYRISLSFVKFEGVVVLRGLIHVKFQQGVDIFLALVEP
jgi:hypothetical protein